MDNRTDAERRWHLHMSRWGRDGYPIRKRGRTWIWETAFGVGGAPVSYRTKREAVAAVEVFIGILCDKAAGRL